MKKIFILILALTLSASINASTEQTQPTNKREQRKLKQQSKILRALDILQSGKFKIIRPISFEDRYSRGMKGYAADLDVSNSDYEVKSTETNAAKCTYTLVYYCALKTGVERTLKVEYNFKNGYLEVKEYTHKGSRTIVAGNYSCVYALDEEPVK